MKLSEPSRRILILALSGTLSIGLFFAARSWRSGSPVKDPHLYDVPLAGSQLRGRPDAPVTIVEFGDIDCPACRSSASVIATILERHPQEVRFVWMSARADTRRGRLAHHALLAARAQDRFWQMHDLLLSIPREEVDEHTILIRAPTHGIDPEALRRFLRGKDVARLAEEDVRLAASMGVLRGPTFFINGRRIEGAVGVDAMAKVVRSELARANVLLKAGISRDRIYEMATRGGRTVIEPPKPKT